MSGLADVSPVVSWHRHYSIPSYCLLMKTSLSIKSGQGPMFWEYLNARLNISCVCFDLTSSPLTSQVSSVAVSCIGVVFVFVEASQCSQRGWQLW